MAGFTVPASFQNIEKTGEIGVEIGMEILQRVTDTSLRGKMHDGTEFAVTKNGFYALAIGEIDLVETEVVEFAKNGYTRVLQHRIIVVVDTVDAHDRAASLQKAMS